MTGCNRSALAREPCVSSPKERLSGLEDALCGLQGSHLCPRVWVTQAQLGQPLLEARVQAMLL